MTREKGFLAFDIFQKIIDEAAQYGAGIRFIRWGEPFLNNDIFKMIEYVKNKGLVCHVTNNGLMLTKESLENIVNSKLDSIIFSFQGTNKKGYELMRNNNQYDKLIESISYLHKFRDDSRALTPFIQVSTTVLDETEEELEQFISEWKNIADKVDYWFTSFARVEDMPRVKQFLGKQTVPKYINKSPCNEVMTKLSVNWNGDVTACCADYEGDLVLGNIKESNLKMLWECDKLDKYREILRRGGRQEIKLCSLCFVDAKTRPKTTR